MVESIISSDGPTPQAVVEHLTAYIHVPDYTNMKARHAGLFINRLAHLCQLLGPMAPDGRLEAG